MRCATARGIAPSRRFSSSPSSTPSLSPSPSAAAPRAPLLPAGEEIRQQAQLFLQRQIADRAHRKEVDSAHRVRDIMERLNIPSNRVIDLSFMSVLRPPEAREIFKRFTREDPQFSEAVISMVNGLSVSGEFHEAADLLRQHDAILTRTEPNARQILLFWLSFNRVPEALAEMRRQESAGRKDPLMRTYALVAAANNNMVPEADALLEEAHAHEIPVPPWAYDRVMALYWRFNMVPTVMALVKEIQTRSPLHWQRPNGSLKYAVDLLLRTNNWTEENVNTLLNGCNAAQAELVLSVIQRFDYPASRAQQLQAQVRAMVVNEAAPTPFDSPPMDMTGKQRVNAWEDLELS